MPQSPASPTPTRGEGQSDEHIGDGYLYGPGTSRGPSNAGSFGGGAYHGPTTDGDYDQHVLGADYAESIYVEPRRDEPRYEEPRRAQGNGGPQEVDPWFAPGDLPKHDYRDQGPRAQEYQAPGYPDYGGRHRNEEYGGQGPQHWQGGYQGEGFADQQPAPPPIPPNAQRYPDQSGYPGQFAAGYPGPAGGHSGQAAPQFGNGYPGRPPNGFPPSASAPPAPATGYPPSANGFQAQPTGGFPPGGGFPPQPGSGFPPQPGDRFPPGGFPHPPDGGFPPPAGGRFPPQPGSGFPPGGGFPPQPGNGFTPGGFPHPPDGGFPPQPGGSPSTPPGDIQPPPAGPPFPPPGFPSPPRPGEFQGFQPPNIPDGAQFGQMPYGGPAAPTVAAAMPWYQRLGSGSPRVLIGGAVALVVVVGGAVLAAPKLLGPSDPGCASYTGTALTAYNRTISDLNAQASQTQLTSDMTSTIADLTTAADKAKSASVKSALDGLSGELSTILADVQKGSVSAQTVAALNSASHAADNAC